MFWCSAASPTSWTRSRCPWGHLLRVFLTKCDGLAFFGESVAFGHLLPHPSPLPQLPPFRHIADAFLGICNVSLWPHAMNMPISACPLHFSVSPPSWHENTSYGDAFLCPLHFLPIRTLTCPLVCVGGQFSTARHENVPHMSAFSCLATLPPHQDTPNIPKWVR